MPKLEDFLGKEILVTVKRWTRYEEDGDWKTDETEGTSKMLLKSISPTGIHVWLDYLSTNRPETGREYFESFSLSNLSGRFDGSDTTSEIKKITSLDGQVLYP